ncbi:hypothetical protein GCM10008967_37950 [Bacillus carboniphilus]|uniref:Lipoprotein n=1 Tax=Bacillus carboniphilus TaxID=86663 RepID=A0ABN0WQA7_9BACI
MKIVKRLLPLFCFIPILLITGCTKNETASISDQVISELQNKVEKLEQTIERQQESITAHNNQLNKINEGESLNKNIAIIEESYSYLQNHLFVLETVIQHTTTSKTAVLNSAEIIGDSIHINITYTNKIRDENAPNNFRLVETGEGTRTISITDDVPILILDGPSKLKEAEWEHVGDHQRFLQLFEKNGEVVCILEWYIP